MRQRYIPSIEEEQEASPDEDDGRLIRVLEDNFKTTPLQMINAPTQVWIRG